MGSTAVTSELGLDLRPPSASAAAARGVALVLKEAAMAGEGKAAKLEEYLRGLEDERRKIEGFRRELPLCMFILSDVIEGVKEELSQCRGGDAVTVGRPVLEFMPIKRKFEEIEKEEDGERIKQEDDFRDKVNWMSSAQLWSDNHSANTSSTTTSNTVVTNNNDTSSSNSRKSTRERTENGRRTQGDKSPFTESKHRDGGAFLPFKVLSSYPGSNSRKEEKVATTAITLPDLSLIAQTTQISCGAPSMAEDQRSGGSSSRCSSRGVTSSAANSQPNMQAQQLPAPPSQQAPRKPRRCWSPELHRRFVKALQQLGGSQAATPKQIRELMKVDGLTNDEVKSHLQKYRLHTRRTPTPSPATANQQMVVLGGLWVSPGSYPKSKQSTSPSGSPQGPLHLSGSNPPAVTLTGEDSCEEEEEEEDGKSESYNWKDHSQRSNGEETD